MSENDARSPAAPYQPVLSEIAGLLVERARGEGIALTALISCDIGEGDEVIVPGMTFVASAGAVLSVNATPVLVDIESESLCIDVTAAEAAITERTRAIIAVHVAGAAADLDALTELCRRRDLKLIEDCAHAHGTF
jgi:dTDP-4-amino-4,6-dideoxygalactose transaminase